MSRFLLISILALLPGLLWALRDDNKDVTVRYDYECQVKCIDEFMGRFNGNESKPDLFVDSLNRRDNILALFDTTMSYGGLSEAEFQSQVLRFVDTVLLWTGRLSITDSGVLAEAKCAVSYHNHNGYVTLFLKREKLESGNLRWAIKGVNGLYALGAYNDKTVVISPVDHELNFISLDDFFQVNQQITPSLRSTDTSIDELSMFFGLTVAGAIDFKMVEAVKMHFFDVPGYVFTVDNIVRQGTNSGWLITQLKEMPDSLKSEYTHKLMQPSIK